MHRHHGTPIQKRPRGHFSIKNRVQSGKNMGRIGAGERNRTPDRLITNQLLYLLSYASLTKIFNNAGKSY
jgi:hypothetical protein